MMKTQPKIILALLAAACLLAACKKDFLDARPDKSVLVPATLSDFQAILDNGSVMNLSPEIGLIASDEFYTTADGLAGLYTQTERGSYLWAADVYQGETVGDWDIPYQQVFYSNVILEGLDASPEKASAQFGPVKGSALFYRGLACYNLAQVFAQTYDPVTADQAMGIPLKSSADIHEKISRGTLAQTYARLLSDLQSAAALLPVRTAYKSRPNKAAAYGLLARVYLGMGVYDKAGAYADSSLQLNSHLNNYTDYNPTDYRPFPLALPDTMTRSISTPRCSPMPLMNRRSPLPIPRFTVPTAITTCASPCTLSTAALAGSISRAPIRAPTPCSTASLPTKCTWSGPKPVPVPGTRRKPSAT
ncbi:MAG: RagB/SusD family nutrient uptake outer membrane protein [Mucilaginibacter sp.]|nr:RagB/SusD family nutrient uptake outer membrane protein [Mucilaginibacter sp.]